jgi:hypothetical protein
MSDLELLWFGGEVARGPVEHALRRHVDEQAHVVPVHPPSPSHELHIFPQGCRAKMVSRKYVSSSGMLDMSVTMRSSQTARPCTSTAPGFFTPLPVGSENDRLTCGLRRMLNAFCGKPDGRGQEEASVGEPARAERPRAGRAVLAEGGELTGAVASQDRLGVRRDRRHATTLRPAVQRRQRWPRRLLPGSMSGMAPPQRRLATYADLVALPEGTRAEVLAGGGACVTGAAAASLEGAGVGPSLLGWSLR